MKIDEITSTVLGAYRGADIPNKVAERLWVFFKCRRLPLVIMFVYLALIGLAGIVPILIETISRIISGDVLGVTMSLVLLTVILPIIAAILVVLINHIKKNGRSISRVESRDFTYDIGSVTNISVRHSRKHHTSWQIYANGIKVTPIAGVVGYEYGMKCYIIYIEGGVFALPLNEI